MTAKPASGKKFSACAEFALSDVARMRNTDGRAYAAITVASTTEIQHVRSVSHAGSIRIHLGNSRRTRGVMSLVEHKPIHHRTVRVSDGQIGRDERVGT